MALKKQTTPKRWRSKGGSVGGVTPGELAAVREREEGRAA
jgi:hypothetical protein